MTRRRGDFESCDHSLVLRICVDLHWLSPWLIFIIPNKLRPERRVVKDLFTMFAQGQRRDDNPSSFSFPRYLGA